MSLIQNVATHGMESLHECENANPFAADAAVDEQNAVQQGLIHIRIQQRSGRKTLTTVQGIHPDYDQKMIVKVLKKEFACNGNVTTHPEYGQGDQRKHVKEFLSGVGIAKLEQGNVSLIHSTDVQLFTNGCLWQIKLHDLCVEEIPTTNLYNEVGRLVCVFV
eukprot:gene9910-2095_t